MCIRDSHYTSHSFQNILKSKKLRQSMSRRGNCWDNAPQESFFGHMKDHIKIKLKSVTDYDSVKIIIDDYIDYYNNERYQCCLLYTSSFLINQYLPLILTTSLPDYMTDNNLLLAESSL